MYLISGILTLTYKVSANKDFSEIAQYMSPHCVVNKRPLGLFLFLQKSKLHPITDNSHISPLTFPSSF